MLVFMVVAFTLAGFLTGWAFAKGRFPRLPSASRKLLKEGDLKQQEELARLEQAKENMTAYFRLLDENDILYTHGFILNFKRFGFQRSTHIFNSDDDAEGLRFVSSCGYAISNKRGEYKGGDLWWRRIARRCTCGKTSVGLYVLRRSGGEILWHRIATLCLGGTVHATKYLEEEDIEWVRKCETLAKRLNTVGEGPYRTST